MSKFDPKRCFSDRSYNKMSTKLQSKCFRITFSFTNLPSDDRSSNSLCRVCRSHIPISEFIDADPEIGIFVRIFEDKRIEFNYVSTNSNATSEKAPIWKTKTVNKYYKAAVLSEPRVNSNLRSGQMKGAPSPKNLGLWEKALDISKQFI